MSPAGRHPRGPAPRKVTQSATVLSELVIVAVSVLYLVTGEFWALLVWMTVTASYLAVGLLAVWNGDARPVGGRAEIRFLARWSWTLPIISSGVGVSCAVAALVARRTADGQIAETSFALAASIGVVLSWALLHVGFANVYQALDESCGGGAFRFPSAEGRGRIHRAAIDYSYFAFTIGTAFATSDAQVLTVPARRIVLIHSVVGFFYNAIVVAVALQVLQQLAGQG